MTRMYEMSEEEREAMAEKGINHVRENYDFENFEKTWVNVMDNIHEKYGSWENRKGFKSWDMVEIR